MVRFIFLLLLILDVTGLHGLEQDHEKFLDNRLELDLDGKGFSPLVETLSFEELKMWGDYKKFKVNAFIKQSFEEKLEGTICFVIAMEPPYAQMPIYPKEFLVSFSERAKAVECYLDDMINIYPANKKYLEKVKQLSSRKN